MFFRKRRADAERDLKDEIAFHLAADIQLRIDRGQTPEEAKRAAVREFGNVPLVEEVTRDMWAWASLERLARDFTFALRALRRDASFSLVALSTLALGIGAAVSVFAVVNSLLLRPLPYPKPERLVMVWERTAHTPKNLVSGKNFVDWRARNQAFAQLGAISQIPLNISGLGPAEQVDGVRVTAEFFDALGVPPLVGRVIRSGEDVVGGFRSVVLGYRFWQTYYGGARDAIGRVLTINGWPHEIVGIMPPDFYFPGVSAQLFIPLPLDLAAPFLGRNLVTVARLRPGISVEAAQAQMEAVAAQIAAERPQLNAGYSAAVIPLKEQAIGETRRILWVLFGAVGCLLLLACANVANLSLMRATTRIPEMAVRMALGAGRWQLIHQLLAESVVLAAAAGAIGLLIARWVVPVVPSLFPPAFPLPRGGEVGLDVRVAFFAVAVSAAVAIVFGIVPALPTRDATLANPIRGFSRTVVASHPKVRRGLVVAEIALALVLVMGAGLMGSSLMHLYRVKPGFDAEHVLSMRMLLLPSKYGAADARIAFLGRVLAEVRQTPGVVAASSVHFLPLSGVGSSSLFFRADQPEPPREEGRGGTVSIITPDYFRTMGIPFLEGRDFDKRDELRSPRVAIVNETLAKEWFPEGSPLGKHLRVYWSTPAAAPFEIVGVAADVRSSSIDASPGPAIYIAETQEPSAVAALVVRGTASPAELAPAVRAAIGKVDPDQGVSQVQTLDALVAATTARPRVQATVLGAFGLLALLIASVGLYGVMAYGVEQRRREMGVRLALGAAPSALLRLVMAEGLLLAGIGIVLGGVLSIGVRPMLAGLLYETSAADPRVFAAVGAALLTVSSLALWIPALRATRVDPIAVLRDQ